MADAEKDQANTGERVQYADQDAVLRIAARIAEDNAELMRRLE